MTASTVLPFLFAVGIAFIPLGVGLLVTSNNIKEIIVDYTTDACRSTDPTMAGYPNCGEFVRNHTGEVCKCDVNFELKEDFQAPVLMYYSLTNFYQNHRRYVKSRDDEQLLGKQKDYNSLTQDCAPFRGIENGSLSGGGIPQAPCGAIANSLFNDKLVLTYVGSNGTARPKLLNTNIAWTTDKRSKFNNPEGFDKDPAGAFSDTVKPERWLDPVYELDPANPSNNGYENEDLIVWMRTAALPSFRKLYRRIDHSGLFKDGLPKGNYTLNVDYVFSVLPFGGTKRMVLSTTSWLGGKNPFLGIAYIVVGSLCIVVGVIFLIIHIKIGKKPSEMIQNINSRTEY